MLGSEPRWGGADLVFKIVGVREGVFPVVNGPDHWIHPCSCIFSHSNTENHDQVSQTWTCWISPRGSCAVQWDLLFLDEHSKLVFSFGLCFCFETRKCMLCDADRNRLSAKAKF